MTSPAPKEVLDRARRSAAVIGFGLGVDRARQVVVMRLALRGNGAAAVIWTAPLAAHFIRCIQDAKRQWGQLRRERVGDAVVAQEDWDGAITPQALNLEVYAHPDCVIAVCRARHHQKGYFWALFTPSSALSLAEELQGLFDQRLLFFDDRGPKDDAVRQ